MQHKSHINSVHSPLQVRIKSHIFARISKNLFKMDRKQVEAIIRVIIAILSALLGALTQTSCHVLPHDALSKLIGSI